MMMALALYLNSLKWEANKMKKKIFLVLTTLFMFINKYNAVINNDYNKTVNYANKYIELFKDSDKYIEKSGNGFIIPFRYNNEGITVDSLFKNGGLLSTDEYELTIVNRKSYLSYGQEYWTLTSKDIDSNYCITYNGYIAKKLVDTSATRITEHVLSDSQVTGKGSRTNPWMFISKHKITINNKTPEYGNVKVKEEYVFDGDTAHITLEPKTGYTHDYNTCESMENYSKNNNNILINNITKDITCTFAFKEKNVNVTYDSNGGNDCSPSVKTYKINDNYDLSCTPIRNGFNFDGWYAERTGTTKITTSTKLISNDDHTIYAHWSIKPITLNNQNFNFTYSNVKQNSSIVNATGGSGSYTYTISGRGSSNFNIATNTLYVNGGTPVGIYTLNVEAADSISEATTTAIFTVNIKQATTITTTSRTTSRNTTSRTTSRNTTSRTTSRNTTSRTTSRNTTSRTTTRKTTTKATTKKTTTKATTKKTTTKATTKKTTKKSSGGSCSCSGGSNCINGVICTKNPKTGQYDCCN